MKKQELTEVKRSTKKLKKEYKLAVFEQFKALFEFIHTSSLGCCLREQAAYFMTINKLETNRQKALEQLKYLAETGFLIEYKSSNNIYLFAANFVIGQITNTQSKNAAKISRNPRNIAFNTLFAEFQLDKMSHEISAARCVESGKMNKNIGKYAAAIEANLKQKGVKSDSLKLQIQYAKALYLSRNLKRDLDSNQIEIIDYFKNRSKNREIWNLSKSDLTTMETLFRSNWRITTLGKTAYLAYFDIENRSIGRIYSDAIRFSLFINKQLGLDCKVEITLLCEHSKRAERRQIEWNDLNKKIRVRQKIAAELVGNQALGSVPQFDKIGQFSHSRIVKFDIKSLDLDRYPYYQID